MKLAHMHIYKQNKRREREGGREGEREGGREGEREGGREGERERERMGVGYEYIL